MYLCNVTSLYLLFRPGPAYAFPFPILSTWVGNEGGPVLPLLSDGAGSDEEAYVRAELALRQCEDHHLSPGRGPDGALQGSGTRSLGRNSVRAGKLTAGQ